MSELHANVIMTLECIYIYIGWKFEKDFSKLGDVTTLTMSIIEQQHYVNVTEIDFISPAAVTSTENNFMRRYELQDDMDKYFQTGKISIFIETWT